jgi:flagellar basal-body rod modification protein FlgD
MTVTAVASSQTTTARQTLAGNFDTFLKLLTTQLKQQDPLQPMDATTYTSQLVQYASVEQAIATNTKLEELNGLARISSTATALSLIGRDVTAATDQIRLNEEGDATVTYRLPAAAETVQVSLLDAQGKTVWTSAAGKAAGENTLAWNGIGTDGQRAAAGAYRVKIDAKTSEGAVLTAEQFRRGRVEGVETQGGDLQLRIDGVMAPLSAITDIRAAA